MGKKHESKSENGSTKKQAKAAKEKGKTKAEEKSLPKSGPIAPKAKSTGVAARKPKPKPLTLSDIQLRAYFVAEKRQREGRPGNEETDWLEAERQLLKERTAKSKVGSTTRKPAAKATE